MSSFTPYEAIFTDTVALNTAINDHHAEQMKGFKLSLCAGNKKSYCCPDKNCSFTLQLLRRKETSKFKTRKSNVLHSVPGHYYVSKFVPHSACLSLCKTSAKELASMPAFHQAVIGSKDKSTSAQVLRCIVAEEYQIDNLTFNIIQWARKIVWDNNEFGVLNLYSELATFCLCL
jgi:hypothetical protein